VRCPRIEDSSHFTDIHQVDISKAEADRVVESAARDLSAACHLKTDDLVLLGVVERDGQMVVQLMREHPPVGYDIAVDRNSGRVLGMRAWQP
jgi:hypothetical protein